VLLVLGLAGGPLGRPAAGQAFNDPGFVSEVVAQLAPFAPVGVTFAPDGRLFVWEKQGVVRVVKNGTLLPRPFVDLLGSVNHSHDRGLLGLALDPGFEENGHVYLLYPYEEGADPEDPGPKTARLTRVTADPADPDVALAGSEIVILGSLGTPPCSAYAADADCIPSDGKSHTIGSLHFASDGKLFVSVGDGASYDGTDVLALRAQDLGSYAGKLLRINPDGSAPGDNPFDDGTNSIRSRVYAYGIRNAYRFALDASGEPYLGNVGWYSYESILRGRGANFGWPCFEGDRPQSGYQNAFQACRDLPFSAVTSPLYYYGHGEGVSVIGGPVYTKTAYPAAYRGNYFFADFGMGWIRRLVLSGSGDVQDVRTFATGFEGIVHLELGPDGYLYYVNIFSGQVGRIRAGGPHAAAAADPTSGYAPLTVSFSSAGSTDSAGGALSYSWDFGDGSPLSAAPNPTHVYAAAGVTTFTARLTVTTTSGPNTGLAAQATVRVTVNSTPPRPRITSPADGSVVFPGQLVTFTGAASDDDEPASGLQLAWQIALYNGDAPASITEASGPGGSFVVDDPEPGDAGTFTYRIALTATDSSGLEATTSVTLTINREGPVGLSPPAAGFGSVAIGAASAWQPVTVSNTSGARLTLGKVTLGGADPGDFQTGTDGCSKKRLAAGQTCAVHVRFRPAHGGDRRATLGVPTGVPGLALLEVTLDGTGVPGDVEASPAAVAFGAVGLGSSSAKQAVLIRNAGAGTLTLGKVELGGASVTQFGKSGDGCSSTTLGAGASCTVTVKFRPKAAGVHTAQLLVPSDDPDEPALVVALSGSGTP
jgi:glucose/arabinose dehydrogenase